MPRKVVNHPRLPFAPGVPPAAPEAATPAGWMAVLGARVGRHVEVAFGRSRTRPVLFRRRAGQWLLHLHAFFARADRDVIDAVAAWLARGRADRGATRRLDEFIQRQLDLLPPPPPAAARAHAHHDLDALAAALRDEPGLADLTRWPTLGWARRGSRPRASLQLGLYVPESHSIRMHPVLDSDAVPAWFVRAILFHELLHAAIPQYQDATGRWIKHGPEFRARERAYRDHARAEAWLAANLTGLLRRARGTPRADA